MATLDTSKLFSVVSRFGLSGAPDDVEAILVDNVVTDPTHALNSIVWPQDASMDQKVQRPGLAGVVYFTKYDEAAQIAAALGPHREGAVVSVSIHFRNADYIWRHASPILECGAPVVWAIDEAIAFMAEAEAAGRPGRTISGRSSLGWRHFGPLTMDQAQELLVDGEQARSWLSSRGASV